jgi:CheY-specific phosphatase CheX
MKTQLDRTLAQVASETLEQLAFLFSFPEDGGGAASDGEPTVRVRVAFFGPFSGLLQMELSEACLNELSANMLGIEEEDTTEAQRIDAVKETINVICGNLLPAVAGRTALFNLDAPEIVPGQAETGDGTLHQVSDSALELEEGRCWLRLSVDAPDTLASLAAAHAENPAEQRTTP